MKVVFAGTPEFAVPCLAALCDSPIAQVEAVYSQPDRPAGRGKKTQPNAVKRYAQSKTVPVFQPNTFQPHDSCPATQELAELEPDLLVVTAYGLLLPQRVLEIPKFGCVNIHASLLPRWRGAAPIQRAIQAGDKQTGITLMQIEQALDCGAILSQQKMTIDPNDTAGKLHDKLAQLGAEVLANNLIALSQQSLTPVAQDDTLASYAPQLKKSESRLDWSQPASILEQTIRAFNPWPTTTFSLNDMRIRIHQSSYRNQTVANSVPGQVVAVDKNGIVVQTGNGQLTLEILQRPGGKAVHARDFINGCHIPLGTLLQ